MVAALNGEKAWLQDRRKSSTLFTHRTLLSYAASRRTRASAPTISTTFFKNRSSPSTACSQRSRAARASRPGLRHLARRLELPPPAPNAPRGRRALQRPTAGHRVRPYPRLLRRHKEEDRDLLALHEIGGLSISSLSELTGAARVTIRTRLARAVVLLVMPQPLPATVASSCCRASISSRYESRRGTARTYSAPEIGWARTPSSAEKLRLFANHPKDKPVSVDTTHPLHVPVPRVRARQAQRTIPRADIARLSANARWGTESTWVGSVQLYHSVRNRIESFRKRCRIIVNGSIEARSIHGGTNQIGTN